MSSRRSPLLRTVASAAMLHGLFTVGLPILILRWVDGIPVLATNGGGQIRWLGAALVAFGIYLYVSSVACLLRCNTTAIPGATPLVLVTDGWYAHTRHPLLLGVVSILFGEAALLSGLALAGYALAYWLSLIAFVTLKEEPDLRRAFGAQFDAYCRDVPRWIPKL